MSEKVLDMTIEELELSKHSYRCLKRAGYDTVLKIRELTEEELVCSVHNLGKKYADEIIRKMAELGLDLRAVDTPTFNTNTEICKSKSNDKLLNQADAVDSFCNAINCDYAKVCSLNNNYCVKKHFDLVLSTLTPKEESVIKFYFGIDCEKRKTYLEIGAELHIAREHVMKIKRKVLRKLRHKSRSELIKVLFPTLFSFSKETPYSKLAKAIFELEGTNSKILKTEVLNPLQKELIDKSRFDQIRKQIID